MPFVNLRYYLNTYGRAMANIVFISMACLLVLQCYLGILTWVNQLVLALSWFVGGILEYNIKGRPVPPTYKVYDNDTQVEGLPGTGLPQAISPNASVRVD